MVRLTVLGSGSAGNATLLQDGDQRVLIDVGLSYREVARRLDSVGVPAASVGAVVITHAHGDHTRGAALFSRRHGVAVHATMKTRAVWRGAGVASWGNLECDNTTEICGFLFSAFEVSHDAAAETVAFCIETSNGSVGFATDVGIVTQALRTRFKPCRLLVMESHHARELLQVGPYAQSMKARISGARGHLSNEELALFVSEDLGQSVECLVLAHLSRVNNVPELAEMTCREALSVAGRSDVRVVVAHQDSVAESVELGLMLADRHGNAPMIRQTALPF